MSARRWALALAIAGALLLAGHALLGATRGLASAMAKQQCDHLTRTEARIEAAQGGEVQGNDARAECVHAGNAAVQEVLGE